MLDDRNGVEPEETAEIRPLNSAPDARILARAREVLRLEAEAVRAQAARLDAGFASAARLMLGARGKVVVAGMGKSGLVGRKIAATLSSTGTPSVFLHPAEAAHGDLGLAAAGDVCLALSVSGETAELRRILGPLKKAGVPVIAMTCRRSSSLGKAADALIEVELRSEACRHNLVPTSSSTAMLALGDALAISLMDLRGFGPEDFARFHPGGSLGRRANASVGELMRRGELCPEVRPGATISEALLAMTRSRLGAVSVVDAAGRLIGFFTDGDLRRVLHAELDLSRPVDSVMTRNPLSVGPGAPAREAAEIMRRFGCDNIPVVDAEGRLLGVVDEKDLLEPGGA